VLLWGQIHCFCTVAREESWCNSLFDII